jgi:hypothetical protein
MLNAAFIRTINYPTTGENSKVDFESRSIYRIRKAFFHYPKIKHKKISAKLNPRGKHGMFTSEQTHKT